MDVWRRMSLAARVVCVCSSLLALVSAQQQQQQTASHQLGSEVVVAASEDDLTAASTTYGHGGKHSDGKFFMYAHQPDKKQYEFGFKRGNDYHNIERYEKAGPNHNFKTKVRWQDAKGGHGEHYWDYNHGPKYHTLQDDHGDDHGGYDHDHDDDDGYGHDDHGHGGYGHDNQGHGGYGHDDHGHGGYGHDDHGHDDHGGYHSRLVPVYAPAATVGSQSIMADSSHAVSQLSKQQRSSLPSKLHRIADAHKPERKSPKDAPGKVGVDKDSGLGKKKNYHYYNEKQTFEYRTTSSGDDPDQGEESPSAFPELPTGTNEEDLVPGSASTPSSSPSRFSRRSGEREDVASVPKDCGTTSMGTSAASGLSFEPESGRVYSEETGLWYSLVPV